MRASRITNGAAAADATVRRLPLLVALGLMAARLVSGFPPIVANPQWYLSYSEGFIRRGLLGTFVMPWLLGLSIPDATRVILPIVAAGAVLLFVTLAALLERSRMTLGDPILLSFLLSGALAWLGTDLGLFDIFLELFSLWAFVLLYRRQLLGVTFCVAVPLTHEGGLFLLMPLLGALWVLRPPARSCVLAGAIAAAAAAAALWFGAHPAHFHWPVGTPPVAPGFMSRLDQGFAFALPQVPQSAIAFSILPSLAIAMMVTLRIGSRAGVVVFGATLATWSVVLIATDTERLLAWGPLTAVVVAGLTLHEAGERLRQMPE